jgi:predicted MFS family arabinose efflux permease
MASTDRPATYREVFALREYRALFLADGTSLLGDQIAAVALAVLLYQRSGSPLVASLGYATAYLPWAIGGPLLSALADRLPPRQVVVAADLARAGLIGLAAIPGLPLPVIGLLVLAAALLAPPFEASISALYAQVLEGDRYPVGISIKDTVYQSAQLVGFVAGGALVATVGSHGALALDAVSFALSALLLRTGLRHRPAATSDTVRSHLLRETWEGVRLVAGDRRLYGPLLLGVLGAAYVIVPEAIAPAYAGSLGGGPRTVGLVMASVAAGSVLGGLVLARLVGPTRRRRLMWPLALLGTGPLMLMALRPSLPVALALLAVAGAASAFQLAANAAFAAAAPAQARARVFGVAMTGMWVGQGLAIVAAGAVAQLAAPHLVIAGAGFAGMLAVAALRPAVSGGSHRSGRSRRGGQPQAATEPAGSAV